MELDLSIGNAENTDSGRGALYIYFLKDHPQRSAYEFGRGLNNMFHGIMIEIKENVHRFKKDKVLPLFSPIKFNLLNYYTILLLNGFFVLFSLTLILRGKESTKLEQWSLMTNLTLLTIANLTVI